MQKTLRSETKLHFFFTIVATKFKEAFKGFEKKNEKKKKEKWPSIGTFQEIEEAYREIGSCRFSNSP